MSGGRLPTAPRHSFRGAGGPAQSFSLRPWRYGAAGVASVVAVWTIAAWSGVGQLGTLSRLASPIDVAASIASYATGDLLVDLWASLGVFVGGWAVGGVAAILIGLLLGRVRLAGQLLLPIIEAARPVSSIVWLPLVIVWFGFGYTSKSVLVGLAVFLVVIVYVIDGSARIPADVQRAAAMLGMNRWSRFWHVVVPGTLAETLIGLRVALVAGWGTVIIAELIAANSGLGAHLSRAQRGFAISEVMATMVVFGASGFLLDAVFSSLQRRVVPWRSVRA